MCNSISGNTTGLSHEGTEALTLPSSWWGDPTGPSGDGPGSGDSVVVTGAGSVAVTPVLTAPDETCPYIFADGFDLDHLAPWDTAVP